LLKIQNKNFRENREIKITKNFQFISLK